MDFMLNCSLTQGRQPISLQPVSESEEEPDSKFYQEHQDSASPVLWLPQWHHFIASSSLHSYYTRSVQVHTWSDTAD